MHREVSFSEIQFQTELHVARSTRGGRHQSARSGVDVCSGRGEAGRVGQVERLGAELYICSFADLELLEERQVEVLESIFAEYGRASVTVGELCRQTKCGFV